MNSWFIEIDNPFLTVLEYLPHIDEFQVALTLITAMLITNLCFDAKDMLRGSTDTYFKRFLSVIVKGKDASKLVIFIKPALFLSNAFALGIVILYVEDKIFIKTKSTPNIERWDVVGASLILVLTLVLSTSQ